MRILGIDPGLQTTGFGVVDVDGARLSYVGSGTIKTTHLALGDLPGRLKVIFDGICEITERYQPDAATIFAACEKVVKVKEPLPAERAMLRRGQVLYTYLHLAPDPDQTADLLKSGVTAIAYETVTDKQNAAMLLGKLNQSFRCVLGTFSCVSQRLAISGKAKQPKKSEQDNPGTDRESKGASTKVR